MIRWLIVTVLVVSVFVGRVCPIQEKEGHDVETVTVASTNNANSTLINNSNKTATEPSIKTTEPSIKTTENNKGKPNDTVTTVPLNNSSNAELTFAGKVSDDRRHNCTNNSTKEEDNMRNCYVTPDDDDERIEKNSDATAPVNTTTIATTTMIHKTEESTKSQVPEVAPHETRNKTNSTTPVITVVPLNHAKDTNKTWYEVVSTEKTHPAQTNNSEVADTIAKPAINVSDSSINSVAPLLEDHANANEELDDNVRKLTVVDHGEHMPSGLIALVTAISFGVAIALVYIGMIFWRRYIEYRYGHRELLVNELEFDTNDLRHFEL